MSAALRDLPVLVLDCQASGATPAHGDLLEIAWAVCDGAGLASDIRASWVVPASTREVPRAVRKLTGWDESCLESAVPVEEVKRDLRAAMDRVAQRAAIHYARFELGFLAPLLADGVPLDVTCVHAIARRLHPELPRRSLRALAGHLGHPASTARRAAGHVEATAFVWKAFVAALSDRGVTTWPDLAAWLESPPPRAPKKRAFPLAPEKRRSLPDAPGVYRFVRRSGDVLYVGKAASLKKRVASHFTSAARATERALEMLTQVDAVDVTRVATALEAALLETDEIKRLDPPYNVQLKRGTRSTWFASRDLRDVAAVRDAAHPLGPLPSEGAVASLAALRELAATDDGGRRLAADAPELRSRALGVPPAFVPDAKTFLAGLATFLAAARPARPSRLAWLGAARMLGAEGDDDEDADDAPDAWTPETVHAQLARALVNAAGALERARRMTLLATSQVSFVEPGRVAPRTIVLEDGDIVATTDEPPLPRAASRRPSVLDVDRYDRLRVLVTELNRLAALPGARVAVRVGGHVISWSGTHVSTHDA